MIASLRHLRLPRLGLLLAATLNLVSCAGDPNMALRNTLDGSGEQVTVIEERSEQLEVYTPEEIELAATDLEAAMSTETLPSDEAAVLGPGAEATSSATETAMVEPEELPAAAETLSSETNEKVDAPSIDLDARVADWQKKKDEMLEENVAKPLDQSTSQVIDPSTDSLTEMSSDMAENSEVLPLDSQKAQVQAEDAAIESGEQAKIAETSLDPEALKTRVDVSGDQQAEAAAQAAADTSPTPPDNDALPADTPEPSSSVKTPEQVAAEEKNVTTTQATTMQKEVTETGSTNNDAYKSQIDNPGIVAPADPLTEPESVPEQLERETIEAQSGDQPGIEFETNPEARQTENAAGQTPNPLTDAFGATEPKPVVTDKMADAPVEAHVNEPTESVPATQDTSSSEAKPVEETPAPEKKAETTEAAVDLDALPAPDLENQVAVVRTVYGTMVIEMNDAQAPKTAANFRKLINEGFYNKTTFHRVIPDFMIQGGDPNSKNAQARNTHGDGGPGYTLPPEIGLKHVRGSVAMARLPDAANPGRESNGSQFYICVVNCPFLDGDYTVFGKIIKGMEVADRIASSKRDAKDNPLKPVYMEVTMEDKAKALK